MEGVYHQNTSRDETTQAVMDVTDKKGVTRNKKFTLHKLGSLGDSKVIVRFTDPPDVRGVALLSVNRKGVADRQWMYTPAIQRIRRIAPQERSRKFLGTDFTNEDMQERVLDDFNYRLIAEGEIIGGHKTWKIESKPVSPDRSQYSVIYLWVAQDAPVVLFSEMYDEQGNKVRLFHASKLERISGIWVARRLEISTPADNTKTVLNVQDIVFNTGLREDQFTQQALEKGNE